ncbi:MAG TPA: shikimate kinase [Terriglobales bacterium]
MTPDRGSPCTGEKRDGTRRSIFLVGFMGAGKTSVGRALSRHLGWDFADLDQWIEATAGRTITEIFEASGEPVFRKIEHTALRNLCDQLLGEPKVIALGGGAFVQPKNVALIEGVAAHTVFLDAPPEELLRRCRLQPQARPLCSDVVRFRQLYEARKPGYLGAARRIETQGKEIEAVAMEVACVLGV